MAGTIQLTGRASCPTCGHPSPPGSALDVSECPACGVRSHVARRVRMIEPVGVGDFDPGVVVGRSDVSVQKGGVSVPCPGCASPLETEHGQALARCGHCGTWAKIERILSAEDAVAPVAYPERAHRFRFLAARSERRDAERDACIDRALAAATDPEAIGHLLRFTPWEAVTPDREQRLTRLLEQGIRSTILDRASCVVVRKLLLHAAHDAVGLADHPWRYLVLRCVARVAFRPGASGRLIQELRHVYGGGAAVKLLLEVADYALGQGHDDYAEDALDVLEHALEQGVWSARHDRSPVLLYRLAYVDERVAAWLLTQVAWLWTVEPPLLARFVDDCALERPTLATAVANRVTYRTCVTFDAYIDHLRFLHTLFTPLGRAVALESYVHVPGPVAPEQEEHVRLAIETFEGFEEDEEAGIAATRLLRWWADALADHSPDVLPGVAAALRQRLPEEPTWPRPPRPSPSETELERLAASFRDGVEQRSHADRDPTVREEDTATVDEAATRLDALEDDLFRRTRRWRYGRV